MELKVAFFGGIFLCDKHQKKWMDVDGCLLFDNPHILLIKFRFNDSIREEKRKHFWYCIPKQPFQRLAKYLMSRE